VRPIHWVGTHLGAAAFAALIVLAYWGWHRPLPSTVVNHEIQTVLPGTTKTIVEQVPGSIIKLPEVVTVPVNHPDVRVITVEKPVVVPGPEVTKIITQSPETVTIHIAKICIHGQVNPDCGAPLSPDITAVRSGDGFKVVQDPTEAQTTQVGPVTTTIKVPPTASRWVFRVGAGTDQTFRPLAVFQSQYSLTSNLFVQGTVTYPINGSATPGLLIFAGLQL